MEKESKYYSNLVVSSKYLKELPKLAKVYEVTLNVPIVVSADEKDLLISFHGTEKAIISFVQKFYSDEIKRALNVKVQKEVDRKNKIHTKFVTKDDVTDVSISIGKCHNIDEFIKEM